MDSKMRGSYKSRQTAPPLTPAGDWSDPKPVVEHPTQYEVKADPQQEAERKSRLSGIKPAPPKPRPSFMSQNKLELDALRERIRKGEPLLTLKQIRRIGNPFYMSVIMELEALGYPESSEYIQELNNIDYDRHEYDNIVAPFLRNSRDVLKVLCIGLKKAENAKRQGDTEAEAMSILDLARHFSADDKKDWYWLANELFQRSVDIIVEYSSDYGEKEATVRYIFAKFLFKKRNQLSDAEAHLMITMRLSEGRSWNLSEILHYKEDYLYFQSCYLLHEILLAEVAEIRNKNPTEAIELCRRAVLHVDETQKHPEMEKAMFQLILSYEAANDLPQALTLLEKYMDACKEHGEIDDSCHGHLMFASCYRRLNNSWMAKKNLEDVIRIAELNNLPLMKATAHSRIVQYFLGEMEANELVEHAMVAYVMYTQLRMSENAEEMRCLVGISAAQAIMPQYVPLLLSSENVFSSQFNTFMNWKTIRKPFVTGNELIQPESDILNTLKPRMDRIRKEEQEYYRTHILYEQVTEPSDTPKASITTNATTSEKSTKSVFSETQSKTRTSF